MPPGGPEEDPSGRSAARYEVAVSPRALTQALSILAVTLLVYHVALWICHYKVRALPWLLLQLFDVDEENNLPTWYSEILLLIAWVFLWLCARKKHADGDRWARHWRGLTVGFLLMAVDEIASVHETINSVIEMSWAVPAGIGLLAIGLVYIPFLLHLPRPTALGFMLAGVIYVTGAVGMEIVGNTMAGKGLRDTLAYRMSTAVEEGLEMLGLILFINVLLHYMRGPGDGPVRASVGVAPDGRRR
jgi:hypothetical protein